jgi:electron transfer flavoprotein alpha subunit
MNCIQTAASTQNISLTNMVFNGCNIDINASQNSTFSFSSKCTQNLGSSTDVQNKIKEAISNELKASSGFLATGSATTNSDTELANRVANSIDISQVTNCINKFINEQTIVLDKFVYNCTSNKKQKINLQQEVLASFVSKCVAQQTSNIKAVADLDQTIKNKQTAES